jgi:hypothetical protein
MAPAAFFFPCQRWVAAGDANFDKVLKENLKKDRLAKSFAGQTAKVARLVEADSR